MLALPGLACERIRPCGRAPDPARQVCAPPGLHRRRACRRTRHDRTRTFAFRMHAFRMHARRSIRSNTGRATCSRSYSGMTGARTKALSSVAQVLFRTLKALKALKRPQALVTCSRRGRTNTRLDPRCAGTRRCNTPRRPSSGIRTRRFRIYLPLLLFSITW